MRAVGWEERMKEALAARKDTLFAWGHHDCVLFACYVIEATCGIDFAKDFCCKYATEPEACEIIKDYAGGGIEEAVEKIALEYKCEEVPPSFAQRCDVMLGEVLIHGDVMGDSIGVCLGEFVAFAAPIGFVQLPISATRRAWRIS